VVEYGKKKAQVAYFESLIRNPKTTELVEKELTGTALKNILIKKTFYANPAANGLRLGEKNAMVFEIQRLLNSKGDSIRHDGLFSTETFSALQNFEAKNGLLPDGKLDAITLEYLLQ
ncbi:MAG: peptidoglycan-binding protein, partial [Bacteroidetes bacterium]|nr:peptidoglycan-binding protein [Bacteroidota bacterium]